MAIEDGPAGEVYLRFESGDMVTAFRDNAGRIVIQLPPPARGVPHAVLTDEEAGELAAALRRLLQPR